MGSAESVASAMSSCVQLPSISHEDVRPPWALAQADKFEYEDCPFCRMRRSHCSWLQTEIKRLKSEAAAVQTTIPPIFLPELMQQLEAGRLPPSGYTGGVDDIIARSCPRCEEWRQEVLDLQEEARELDAQCKARIEFRSGQARNVEDLLIAKRRIEAKLLSAGGAAVDDGKLSVITRVNLADEDALLTAAKHPL
ncbi:EF-hand domain-containing protein [Durusdinium trenchii]|uniref:EF-hand domain-containing protein n=1 Tax=Durusdinium trenchii TaxID=1381693 RepID=A0ABP0K7B9_9DINO